MYQVEKDPKCQAIEQELADYARKVKDWEIDRRRYIAAGGNKFTFSQCNPYPYNDRSERKFFNTIDNYLLSLSEEDRTVANYHLLKKFKDYFSEPFAHHAIELARNAVMAHPLSSADKVEFLETLFEHDKGTRKDIIAEFGDKILSKLTNYNPNNNLEATNRLYIKSLAYFSKPKRQNDERIGTLYAMFKVFSKNVKQLSPEAVVNYAKIYFAMSDRTSKKLDASILEMLAIKTPDSLKASEFCSDNILDKEAVKGVFAAYSEHVLRQKEVNANLLQGMANWANQLFFRYRYTAKEADELIAVIRPQEVDEKGHKVKVNQPQSELNRMADWLSLYHQSLQNNVSGRSGNTYLDASADEADKNDALEYARNMFSHARRHYQNDMCMDKLFRMLTKNGAMDKELLLDVVDAYGQSLTYNDVEQGYYNEGLHRKMTTMLSTIVVEYDYSPKELSELKQHIEKGAGRHEEFSDMGRIVENAISQSTEWRYESIKAKKPTIIVHNTKNGKGSNCL